MKVIAKTVQETPPPNATRWNRATMAEAVGMSPSSVRRIGADAGLKGDIVEEVTDRAGLYLDPQDRTVVLCVEEKSRI